MNGSTLQAAEKRQLTRHQLSVRVELPGMYTAESVNVSSAGVYFVSPHFHPAPGDVLTFTLVLGEYSDEPETRLTCVGTVVRVEEQRGRFGIAVRIDRFGSDPNQADRLSDDAFIADV